MPVYEYHCDIVPGVKFKSPSRSASTAKGAVACPKCGQHRASPAGEQLFQPRLAQVLTEPTGEADLMGARRCS